MLEKIQDFIKKQKFFAKDEKLILAISGGIDSIVLFDILIKLGYDFLCCHVNHNIRNNTEADLLLIKNLCYKHNILLEDCTLTYPTENFNFHDYTHHQRYAFFNKVANKHKITKILTAHHADDQLETILLKISRGSNLYGYAGINPLLKEKNISYIRPLLNCSKEEIIAYQQANQLAFIEDNTNLESKYMRNYFRNEVIPKIKKSNQAILQKVQDYHQILSESFQYIRNNSLAFLANKEYFSIKCFKQLDIALQKDIISYFFELHNVSASSKKIAEVIKQIYSRKSQFSLQLNTDFLLTKEYDIIKIQKKTTEDGFFCLINNLTELKALNNKFFYFTEEIANCCLKNLKLCYNNIDFPLTLRYKTDGDYIDFAYGRKKVKKIFIDFKIPMQKRTKIPLVAKKGNEVIWIPQLDLQTSVPDQGEHGFLVYKSGRKNA
ncbi:MAG: tRNA lysidine(34) synthetase TilS [Erysipelotrichales bacterium]|nr:tRNA lysidine(34) synthetase TilS [Erysipelotrichales bacterium]